MNTHSEKTSDNKSQSVANEVSQMQNGAESLFQFEDNRPETLSQRKLHEMANHNSKVNQLRVLHEIAINRQNLKLDKQLQAKTCNHTIQQTESVQKRKKSTRITDNLQLGVESLPPFDKNTVKVHSKTDNLKQLIKNTIQNNNNRGAEIHYSEPTVVQLLSTGEAFLGKTDHTDVAFQNIGDLLNRYNLEADKPNPNADVLNQKFSILRQIDHAIYSWFGQVTINHSELARNHHSNEMHALLNETETEHIHLVDQTKDNLEVLPFETNDMEAEEIESLTELWRSVVQETGKIKLVGGDAYNMKIRSELVKIMDTKEGHMLLRYLNTETLNAPLADAMTNIYIGEITNQLPAVVLNDQDINTDLNNLLQSEAQPLGNDEALRRLGEGSALEENDAGNNNLQNLNTATDFRNALVSGKHGVILNNNKYMFGAGTGSFVRSVPGNEAIPYNDNLHEIVRPGFVTLGHELGHSAHMRGGGTTLNAFQQEFGTALSGKTVEETRLLWDNSEELINIKNWENPIRTGHQATERGGHKSKGAVLRTNRLNQLQTALQPIYIQDPIVAEMPDYINVTAQIVQRVQNNELDNDEIYDSIQESINNLTENINNASIQAYKRDWLQTRFDELVNTRQNTGWYTRKVTRNEWRAVRNDIQNNMDAITGIGNYDDYSILKNSLRNLREQHGLPRN